MQSTERAAMTSSFRSIKEWNDKAAQYADDEILARAANGGYASREDYIADQAVKGRASASAADRMDSAKWKAASDAL
jgi:hypothetical protein